MPHAKSNYLTTGARRAAGLLLCLFLLAPFLRAQNAVTDVPQKFWRRFSLGVRLCALPLNYIGVSSNTTGPTSTESVTQTTTEPNSTFGGGATVEYAVSRRLQIGADLLYHRFNITGENTTVTTLSDGTIQTTDVNQAVTARYWDLPVLARYTFPSAKIGAGRIFLGGGAVARRATDIRTTTLNTDINSNVTVSYTPLTPEHSTILGVVATAGVRAVDDFGIRVTPEVRYVRWLDDMFAAWPAQQRRNELQVLIGITF